MGTARRKLWLGGLGLCLLAAMGAVAWIGMHGQRPPPGAAGTAAGVEASDGYPRQWKDAHGIPVDLRAPPRTIASHAVATDHLLFAIVPPSRIVAVSALARLPQYSHIATDVRALGIPAARDAETVLTLEPSLLVASEISAPDFLRAVRASGIPVYAMRTLFARLDEIADAMELVGELSGNNEAARRAADDFRAEVRAASGCEPDGSAPQRVLGVTYSRHCYGRGSLFEDIAHALGAVNVGSEQGLGPSQKIDPEQIAAWNPDWIVAGTGGRPPGEARAALIADPAVRLTRAGRLGQILAIEDRDLTAMSQHVLGTMRALAEVLCPATSPR